MLIKEVGMKKYKIIYADPPWRYDQKRLQGVAEKHYATMNINDICALPVADLADKDCVLFLWATFPMLPEAFSELLFKPRRLVSSLRIGSCMLPRVFTTSFMLLWATSDASFAVWIYGTIVPSCSERAVSDASV